MSNHEIFSEGNYKNPGLEQEGIVTPRLRLFADLRSGERQGETGEQIVEHLGRLSRTDASRQEVQTSVSAITTTMLTTTFEGQPRENMLLVPVLRAGLSMWGAANDYFENPETSFLMGEKEKGTDRSSIIWPKKNSLSKRTLILDPIIATGDTLVAVNEEIEHSLSVPPRLTVLACYAAPQGVEAVLDRTENIDLVVGCMAESVDPNGYLVPPTNGDMGDKLFGPIY